MIDLKKNNDDSEIYPSIKEENNSNEQSIQTEVIYNNEIEEVKKYKVLKIEHYKTELYKIDQTKNINSFYAGNSFLLFITSLLGSNWGYNDENSLMLCLSSVLLGFGAWGLVKSLTTLSVAISKKINIETKIDELQFDIENQDKIKKLK